MDQWKPGTPVIPKDDLVEVFHRWDRTKDKSKTKSFNRAKEWISKLLMCPFPELPDHHKMRKIDTINAFEHMLESSRSGASLRGLHQVSYERAQKGSASNIWVRLAGP